MLLDQKKSKENTIQQSIVNRIPGYNNQSLEKEVTKRNSLLNSHNKSTPNDSCYRLSKVFPRPEGRRGEAKNGAGVNEFRGNAASAGDDGDVEPGLLREKVMFVKSLLQLLSELATACRAAAYM